MLLRVSGISLFFSANDTCFNAAGQISHIRTSQASANQFLRLPLPWQRTAGTNPVQPKLQVGYVQVALKRLNANSIPAYF
jgi:hypothetical protein